MKTQANCDTDVMTEVQVMLEVAQALERLSDRDARQRVLNWLNERYQIQSAAAPIVPQPVPAAAPPADPCLTVDGLSEFFPVKDVANVELDRVPAEPAGVENMIRGFAADFRRFALEWQGA